MNLPKIKCEIRAILTDQNGKIIKRYPWKRANSLLKQFLQLLAAQMTNTSQVIKDTGGTDRSAASNSSNLRCGDAGTSTTYGIVIGTGVTAVTMTDHTLETQVKTNIAHQAMLSAVENPNTSTWRIAISRGFANNTGAKLSVKEVGLYMKFTDTPWFVCGDRTLYAVDVSSGVTLTLTYRITVSL